MNNFVEYFYGIKVDKVFYNGKYYSFVAGGYAYRIYMYTDSHNDIKFLYELNKKLVANTLMSEIVVNRNNEVVSSYNGGSYILVRVFVNVEKKISLEEISFISNSMYRVDLNINWGALWARKIDYLEDLINENGKRYPLIVDSFNYFVGMAENAISYFNSVLVDKDYRYVVSHKIIRWDDTVEALYNPLNIVFDYRVRDVAEYIKNSFFNRNYNIFNELMVYFRKNPLSLIDVKLLVARLLYPSFYFEMYEDILIDNKEEKIILEVLSRLDDYEEYLWNVIIFLRGNYEIEEIEWLKRR